MTGYVLKNQDTGMYLQEDGRYGPFPYLFSEITMTRPGYIKLECELVVIKQWVPIRLDSLAAPLMTAQDFIKLMSSLQLKGTLRCTNGLWEQLV